ncbi:unnamed protein product, partial [Sphacelaria rigidula]
VVIAQPIDVSGGTSLSITGAGPTGGIMDGDHTTQLISLSGNSSLHLANMTLANGNSSSDGGAINVEGGSRVLLRGDIIVTGNVATRYGGAIMINASSE